MIVRERRGPATLGVAVARIVAEIALGCSGCPRTKPTALDEPITMWITVIRQADAWRVAEFDY